MSDKKTGLLIDSYKRLLALTCQKELSRGDVAVLGLLLEHHNAKTGRCDPGRSRLAKLSGLSKTAVSNSLAKLEQLDLLRIRHHAGHSRTNAYTLNFGKLNQIRHEFEAMWGGQVELIDEVKDGQAKLTDMVNSTCPERSSRLDTNPLSNPLNENTNIAAPPDGDAVSDSSDNELIDDGVYSSDSELVRKTVTARQENGGGLDTVRTPRDLSPADIARRCWRCDVTMHPKTNGNIGFQLDDLPTVIADTATTEELKNRGAGLAYVMKFLHEEFEGA